jgi:hypothetical protein
MGESRAVTDSPPEQLDSILFHRQLLECPPKGCSVCCHRKQNKHRWHDASPPHPYRNCASIHLSPLIAPPLPLHVPAPNQQGNRSPNTAAVHAFEGSIHMHAAAHHIAVCLKLCPNGTCLWGHTATNICVTAALPSSPLQVQRKAPAIIAVLCRTAHALTRGYHCCLLPDQSKQVFSACLYNCMTRCRRAATADMAGPAQRKAKPTAPSLAYLGDWGKLGRSHDLACVPDLNVQRGLEEPNGKIWIACAANAPTMKA